MTALEGASVRLRALEPGDVEHMYVWENDPGVWRVSGTTAPFSRHMLERFVEEQKFDIFETRQQRLVIETLDSKVVGAVDLFEFDPFNRRAGVGILIHAAEDRGRGYASEALRIVCGHARGALGLHQLWCGAGPGNAASLALFEGAGFKRAGVRRDWNRTADGFEDEIQLQKIL